MKRLIAISGFLALAVLLGATYPLLIKGPELGGAQWQYPGYLLGLLLVPWLFWRGTYGEDARRPRLLLGTIQGFARGPVGLRVWLRDLPGVLRGVGFALLVLALARPLNAVVPTSSEEEGIDLVMVLDLSGSMRAVIENFPEDLARLAPDREPGLRATRLDAAKATIRDFVSRRKTDRIGVVVFGKAAYVLSPPTLDYQLLDTLVSRLRLDLIDPSRTAIGDALGVAMARLRRSQAASKAVILLTDGDNNAGNISPLEAAAIAKKLGVKIYTILAGAGTVEGADQNAPRGERYPVNPQLLEQIATETGGTPYLATDTSALARRFEDILEDLEKSTISDRGVLYAELYPRFLWPAFGLLLLELALRLTRFRRLP
jgi:Ca-activated chloride channel family protein